MKTAIGILTTAALLSAAGIRGTLKDSDGVALEGAIVQYSLGTDVLLDTSGAEGDFTIGDVAILSSFNSKQSTMSLNGQKLSIAGSDYNTLRLYGMHGRRIDQLEGVRASSTTEFQLGELTPANGIYILELAGSDKTYRLKATYTSSGWAVARLSSAAVTPTTAAQSRSSRANTQGELAVYLPGYRTSYITVDDNTNVSVTMIPSKQAQSGTNEYADGMVKIPAAGFDFEMGIWGSSANGESPVHTVEFTKDFWMDTSLVTQGRYTSVMKEVYGDDFVSPPWAEKYGLGDDHPVYEVLWSDCAFYCNALSKLAGLDTVYSYSSYTGNLGYFSEMQDIEADLSQNGYRLPSEAQWEYAARGGSTTDWYWGDEADTTTLNSNSVWAGNSFNSTNDAEYGVQPIGDRKANGYGLYDMAGNLYQWCHELFSDYSTETAVDPVGACGIAGADHMNAPVIRGGSWGNEAEYLRSGTRGYSFANYYGFFLGFRTIRPAE